MDDIFDDPRLIRMHADDNVKTVVAPHGMEKGTVCRDGSVIKETIPQGHKVALFEGKIGDPLIRYGQVIGTLTQNVAPGMRISEDMLSIPSAPHAHSLIYTPEHTKLDPPIEGRTFMGYKNADGRVGCKNLLGIITTVQCVEGVVRAVAKIIEKEWLDRYPNVDGVVVINHAYGCGTAIDVQDAVIPIRTLANLAKHPNFGEAKLVVGLGCEKLPPERLEVSADDTVILQQEQGFEAMMDTLLKKAIERLEILQQRVRTPCPVSDLVVGMQCGGSDALSGVTANPAVGYASDCLVRAGATVLFSEVTEVRDGLGALVNRAIDEDVANALIEQMVWYDHYLAAHGADRAANTSPGNKQGGLANIVEKALGSIVKSGTAPITDVLAPGERVRKKGLVFAATPASDFLCGTLQLAAGMCVQVFTTGRGTPYGLAMAPVIKVSSHTALFSMWKDLIDIDAGTIVTGDDTIQSIGTKIFERILAVASGEQPVAADRYGLENALCLFDPTPAT